MGERDRDGERECGPTLVLEVVLVLRAVLRLLEVQSPGLHIHLEEHLGGDPQGFRLDLRGLGEKRVLVRCSVNK